MKKLLVASLVLLALCPRSGQAQEAHLKVGAILALSGDFSAFGAACKNGMELAKGDLKPEDPRIDLVFEDDALDPAKSVKAFQKLTTAQHAEVVLTFTSGTSNAVALLAETGRIPMIAIGASDPRVVEGKTNVFSFWVSPVAEAKLALKEARKRGYKRVARISALQDGIIAMNHDFDAANKGYIDRALDEQYPLNARDFRGFINRLRLQSKVDAVFAILMPWQSGIFAKQLRDAGVTLPIFGIETLSDPIAVSASDGALTGAWSVQPADPTPEFLKKYAERFPGASSWSAANCYDAVQLLADAIKKKVPLPKYLHTVKDFKGASGTFSSTKDGRFTLAAKVVNIEAQAGAVQQEDDDTADDAPDEGS